MLLSLESLDHAVINVQLDASILMLKTLMGALSVGVMVCLTLVTVVISTGKKWEGF